MDISAAVQKLCCSLCCSSSRVCRDKAAAKLGQSCVSSGAQDSLLVHFQRPVLHQAPAKSKETS